MMTSETTVMRAWHVQNASEVHVQNMNTATEGIETQHFSLMESDNEHTHLFSLDCILPGVDE